MAMTSLNSNEWAKLGFKDFVVEEFVSAPFTEITNRALVSCSLKPMLGIERVRVDDVVLITDEFGPLGQPVFEADSKDSRIRFVGNGWTNTNPEYGLPINTTVAGDFFEITFFGTGLNLLVHTNNAAYDYRATIDGGVEGSNLHTAGTSYSNILGGRSYKPNATIVAASGLSAAWHTVKIRMVVAGIMLFGFEVMNARTDVLFPAGSVFSGHRKESLLTSTSSAYNAGISGVKGARVVKYVKDGVISQAVQEVDTNQLNLSAANHTNEEIIRVVDWLEFGANRSDDLVSLLGGGGTKAFTLNDGTTTVIGSTVGRAPQVTVDDALQMTAANAFITLQFVGTGLDVVSYGDGVNPADNHTFSIDGASIGTVNPATTLNIKTRHKIVSGLPYGTHVMKLNRDAAAGGSGFNVKEFIIYGPKKPTIPDGAIELADYNVMADFTANTVSGTNTIARGVLRKNNSRESTYVQTWSFTGVDTSSTSGFFIQGNTNGGYHEYTFFGTGFEYRVNQPSATATATLSLNGTTLTTANFPSMVSSVYGAGVSFTASTGAMSIANSGGYGQGLRISGLPLGKYTLRVALTSANGWNFESLDIITPVHSHSSGFSVGSLSVIDKRNTNPIPRETAKMDLSKAKALMVWNQSAPRLILDDNIAAVITISTGITNVYFKRPFKNAEYAVIMTGEQPYHDLDLQKRNYIQVISRNTSGTPTDDIRLSIACFGELEDEVQ